MSTNQTVFIYRWTINRTEKNREYDRLLLHGVPVYMQLYMKDTTPEVTTLNNVLNEENGIGDWLV